MTTMALAQSSVMSSSAVSSSSTSALSDVMQNPMNILAAGVSLMTLLGFLYNAIKQLRTPSNIEPRIAKAELDISEIKKLITDNQKDLVNMFTSLKDSVKDDLKDIEDSHDDLVDEHASLEDILDKGMSKLNDTVNELGALETKLSEMRIHLDENNSDRRDEIRTINEDIKEIRENFRNDINDLKAVFMKLMFSLKVKDSND